MGLCLACAFPDIDIALAMGPLVILPLGFMAGFVINPDSIPAFVRWMQWLSPAKYAFAGVSQNEFAGLSLHCTRQQLRSLVKAGTEAKMCVFTSGDEVLETLNIEPVLTVSNCMAFLSASVMGFTTLAYLGLVLTSRKVRAKSRAQTFTGKECCKDLSP